MESYLKKVVSIYTSGILTYRHKKKNLTNYQTATTSVTNKGLVVGKSRISKKNLKIPRLELISAHIASDRKCKNSIETSQYIINHWVNR